MMLKQTNTDQQLTFSDGVFPAILPNQEQLKTTSECCEWIKHNKPELETILGASGAILFRGFPIYNAEDFDAFADAFGYPSFTYKESLSNAVRINYTDRVFTANEAPKDVEIFLHHEMAQTPISPDKLFFFCQSAADSGGATPVCRSDALYAELAKRAPELARQFAEKGLRYITHMPADNDAASGQGRSWKSTLSVEDKASAEEKLKQLGYDWQWQEDGSLRAITPVLPAVIDNHGSKVFYNQLIAAYLGWRGVKDNPDSALLYGDGSSIGKEALDLISRLAEQFTFDVQWQDGDVVLVDNRKVMHGRRPYSGERKRLVLVALAA